MYLILPNCSIFPKENGQIKFLWLSISQKCQKFAKLQNYLPAKNHSCKVCNSATFRNHLRKTNLLLKVNSYFLFMLK